jgi:hypothetical protein
MECVLSSLDIFQRNGLQTSIEDGEYVEFRPLAALDDGPIEFQVKGGVEYLDLNNTFLQVKAKVTKPNGEDLGAADLPVPAPNFFHSLFADVIIFLNTLQITAPSSTYPYLAYIQALLSYSASVKDTQLQASVFYPDTPGHFHAVAGNDNAGMKARRKRSQLSRVMDMVGRLHADIFHQHKYLLSYTDLRLKLTRTKDPFLLLSPAQPGNNDPRPPYKVEIVDVSLYVRKVRLSPAVALAHAKALNASNAVYPLTKTLMRVFSLAQGSFSFREDNLFVDKLPNKVIIGFVRAEAFNGSYAYNPFYFEHLKLTFLALHYQGRQIPSKGFRPDFAGGQYTRSYMSLFTGTNTAWDDISSGITWEAYAKGYTLFCFDLTPSLAHATETEEITKPGPLRIEAQFAEGLPYPINAVVYAEFDGHIEITRSREVLLL